ncbi:MAG: hypothetical protein ABIK83_06700 [Candidatus Zixiibacteriota bacterium]
MMTVPEKYRPGGVRKGMKAEMALSPPALVLTVLLVAFTATAYGQACSCGGAPLMGSLEVPATSAGRWQFGLTYEYHSIADVVSVTQQLKDDNRSRSINSGLLEVSYGLTNRISTSVLFSFLQQERTITSSAGTGEVRRTRGLGDGLFLLKYSLLPFSVFHRRQVTLGVGFKVPLGKSSLTANNVLVSADMQPGSGSFDGVVWGYFYQSLFNIAPIGIQATVSYRLTGNNDHFGRTGDTHRFGKELILTTGVSYSPISVFDYTLTLRYRSVAADQFNGATLPNSGGKWLQLAPGLNLNITNTLSIRFAGQIPTYRRLEGTQLTTSYATSVSVYFSPVVSKEDILP